MNRKAALTKRFVCVALSVVFLLICAIFFVVCSGKLVFEKMITTRVLESAVSDFAKDFARKYSYTDSHGLTWFAGVSARHAVFDSARAEGNTKESADLRRKIMDFARQTLSNPAVMKALYLEHKAETIALVHKHGIADRLRQELARVLPYFNGTATDTLLLDKCEAHRQAYKVWSNCYRKQKETGMNWEQAWDQCRALDEVHDQTFDAIRDLRNQGYDRPWRDCTYFDWAARRRDEGGQELVDAWAWAIADFMTSI